MDAAAYIRALENRQGERIVCPEVIALENGFITQDDLTKLGARLGSSSYGQYLVRVAEDYARH
jgi:glucose-1-phosphate thymidylyltransferase